MAEDQQRIFRKSIMPKISVIVPVYKAEQYIRRCVDSILAQTFTDFELLLIDDGSPDNSGAICDEYAAKDSRIKVFHKENGGVSSARNLGLDNATGEWITFVDSDDWIETDYLQLCLNLSETNNLDFLKFDLGGNYLKEQDSNQNINKDNLIEVLTINNFITKSFNYSVTSFIKKSTIGKTRFNELMKYAEDQLFIFQVLSNCNTCGYLHKRIYKYMINPNSATHSIDGTSMLSSSKILLDFSDSNELFQKAIYETISSLIARSCFDDKVSLQDITQILHYEKNFRPFSKEKLPRLFFCINKFSTVGAFYVIRLYKLLFIKYETN